MKKNVLLLLLVALVLPLFADDKDDLETKAESGNVEAQYELACYYLDSDGGHCTEALRWLRAAAKQKYEKADRLLKRLIADGYNSWGDYDLSPRYDMGPLSVEKENEAKQMVAVGCGASECLGHKGSLLFLAHSYFHKEQYPLAVYYYKQALSLMREDNLGVELEDGKMSFMEASMDAYTMLGFCYEHGYGVEKNLQTAIDYYSLGGLYLEPEVIQNYDFSGIKSILQECNNPELYKSCGDFSEGYGVYDALVPSPSAIRPWDKTRVLFLKMGEYDLAKSFFTIDEIDRPCHELGCIRVLWTAEMYYKGLGVSVDYTLAFKLFSKVVHEDCGPWGTPSYECHSDIYADACYRLYECYAYGRGVERNTDKAQVYFKEALRWGSTSAIYDDQKRYEVSM